MALILAISLSKLKTHGQKKIYTVKADSDQKKTLSKRCTVCLKIYVVLGEKRKRIKSIEKKEKREIGCGSTQL